MLALQMIKIIWMKKDRNPEGSVLRKQFLLPALVEEGVPLDGEGIFVVRREFIQKGKIFDVNDYAEKELESLSSENLWSDLGERFRKQKYTPENIRKQRYAITKSRLIMAGSFSVDPQIPRVLISEEDGNYRIKWYSFPEDSYCYKPVRHGHNEDYYNHKSPVFKKDLFCETAFVLGRNEAGVIEFNY